MIKAPYRLQPVSLRRLFVKILDLTFAILPKGPPAIAPLARRTPYRKILRQYILDRVPISAGTVLLGQPITRRRFHTVTSAANEAGIAVNWMQAILHKHKRLSPSQTGRTAILNASIFKAISKQAYDAVSCGQIEKNLQISAHNFNTFGAAGLIKPVYEIESNR